MPKIMWTLKDLQDVNMTQTCVDGKWVPARPKHERDPPSLKLRRIRPTHSPPDLRPGLLRRRKKTLNYTKYYLNIFQRLHRAWLVFFGKADCFTWPENQ